MREYMIRHMENLREMLEDGEITAAEFRQQYDPLFEQLLNEAGERDAQGTEAQRAETGTGSVHDGPVAESDAPKDDGKPNHREARKDRV